MSQLSEPTRDFLRALASDTRQRLVLLLADGGHRTVSELAAASGLQVSTASQHLTTLRRAGVVRAERTGKEVRYAADPDGIRASLGELSAFLEACCPPD